MKPLQQKAKEEGRSAVDTGREGRGWLAGPDLEERPDDRHPSVEMVMLDGIRDAPEQPFPERVEPFVGIGGQFAQCRQPGGRGNRVTVERAAVADRSRSPRIEDLHQVPPPAERRQGVAAADDLAQRRQVRPDAHALLGPAMADPERDDLVKDEQRTKTIRIRSQEGEELRGCGPDAAGALDRLDDDRRKLGFPAVKYALDTVGIAPGQLDDQAGQRLRNAGGAGHHAVVGAVVRVIEPGDERSSRERTSGPDREHRRLRP